jgi:hypothetical protein
MEQIIIGVDTHKSNHIAVAINTQGARLGALTIPTTCEGYLVRWDEANGYDTWQDLETLASFGQDLLERHDTGRTLEDLALDDLEYVLDRMMAREPYLETFFSRRVVNTQLRDGRHRELMHQQLM